MATPQSELNLTGLAARLVRDGIMAESAARSAFEAARERKIPLVRHLVDQKILSARVLAGTAAREFGVPLFDLDSLEPTATPQDAVSDKLIRTHRALPIGKRGGRLFVAVSDPTNLAGLDEIKFHAGLLVEPVLVEDDKLGKHIDAALDARDTTMSDLMDSDVDLEYSENEEAKDKNEAAVSDAPIVKFVNKMLLDAIKQGASDVHFEPYEHDFRVRYRSDGILHEVASPPVQLAPQIATRIKVMSRMDIAERRVPQDGRIKLRVSQRRSIDFRVNSCPTLNGEKLVLRILDSSNVALGVEHLGFEEEQREAYVKAINKPYGIILVTGPTGSGKTVTLYTALKMLNEVGVNISTVEDPVEIYVPGINQVNTNLKTGLTFAEALRAFLRQDPDIIMVGEIRDLETAEIAVKAAQTGHLVLSTLHTNDAPQSLTRLAQMGVPPYNIASSVLLIMAQRLIRKLCDNCKRPVDIPKAALIEEGFREDEIGTFEVYGPVGCQRCTGGYRGRTGIFQVMSVSEEMGRIIMEGGNSRMLAEQADREGVATMRESGLRKVKNGITSLDEINRVTID
ncbi:MAG: type IV-A pilus assembly ATPase PilB [Chromatiales bacterium]|nr:type IV-A pilus assembly ATPase PilB [Chromatiales bacterium]